ncbi:YdeI/OmpD-associated family protein [Microvirga massiliensis]|uniref:YdeI/OmpD-associated family protein n=1 Tax=Microvirga massiliensis TaxID=1033741 RepID=UPI001FCCFD85|nr:YdeI/OmpD-associated family protein [Microvirga massiliensis]
MTWTDCVVEAIRFGWIDAQKLPLDAVSFLQRLTPRKPKSNWSSKNREHATRLIAEGRMTPAGLTHVEAAKTDGRWENAYSGSAEMTIPRDFLDALATMPAAKAFFETLDRKNLYPIYYRLHTAKRPETRAKRMAQILAQLDRGERFY